MQDLDAFKKPTIEKYEEEGYCSVDPVDVLLRVESMTEQFLHRVDPCIQNASMLTPLGVCLRVCVSVSQGNTHTECVTQCVQRLWGKSVWGC